MMAPWIRISVLNWNDNLSPAEWQLSGVAEIFWERIDSPQEGIRPLEVAEVSWD